MSAATTTAIPPVRTAGGPVRFRRSLQAEWIKFVTVRSSWATLALTLAVAIGLGVLIAYGRARVYGTLSPADRAAFDPTQTSLASCYLIAQLPLSALGILVVTAEYATGTIRGTLTAVPVRGAVFAAKAVLVAALGLVTGLTVSVASYLLGQRILASRGAPRTVLTDGSVVRAVLGSGLLLVLISLLGFASGVLTRATAGGLTLLVSCTLLVPMLAGVLPDWLATWWPPTAGSQITRVVPQPDAAPWVAGIAVLTGSVVVALAAAWVALRTRDA